jgi:hypothetical protein
MDPTSSRLTNLAKPTGRGESLTRLKKQPVSKADNFKWHFLLCCPGHLLRGFDALQDHLQCWDGPGQNYNGLLATRGIVKIFGAQSFCGSQPTRRAVAARLITWRVPRRITRPPVIRLSGHSPSPEAKWCSSCQRDMSSPTSLMRVCATPTSLLSE